MSKFKSTILEVTGVLESKKILFALTRFDKDSVGDPNDLDILVKPNMFQKTILALEENGYTSSSHDQALGGRIKEAQKNLTKPGRIKIDLHQDFTWRASRYFNLDLIWKNLITEKAGDVSYPAPSVATDAFIVTINIIFEKTYLKSEDYDYIKKNLDEITNNPTFATNAKDYGWSGTLSSFIKWFNLQNSPNKWPIFIPVTLVFNSYLEKFLYERRINITSLLYYMFFRTRSALNGVLPYD